MYVVAVFSPDLLAQQPFKRVFPFDVGMGGVLKALMWSKAPPKLCPHVMPLILLQENAVYIRIVGVDWENDKSFQFHG